MKKTLRDIHGNYIVIQSWMSDELKLKGNSLLIFAIIYGFSQTEKQLCTCGIEYMRKWTNSTKQGVLKVLDQLVSDGLVERIIDQNGDKRITAYRAIGQQSLPIAEVRKGQQSLPNLAKKGQQSLPKKPKNRSTKFRASLENNNNNFQTDKSVCQSMRACAREDETDGQAEKEFYLDCIRSHMNMLDDVYKMDYAERLESVITELARWDAVKVNGVEVPTTEVLKSMLDLFRDPERLRTALFAGCKQEVKRKFNYTVTALYNAAKQF